MRGHEAGVYLVALSCISGKTCFVKASSSLTTNFAFQILSYSGGQTHHFDTSLTKRLAFIADPKLGDASISISDVRLSDTATYQCKVKKMPGVDMRKVTLVVMGEEFHFTGFTCSVSQPTALNVYSFVWYVDTSCLCVSVDDLILALSPLTHLILLFWFICYLSQVPPSAPKCWVEGGEEKGGTVSLRCKSSEGSTPLTYVWTRENGAIPSTATQSKQHTTKCTSCCVCKDSM